MLITTINSCEKDEPIIKEDVLITWANPTDIYVGTALSATQLNAIADVAGTFVYTPAIGTVLELGDNQTLQVEFTPADAVNYNKETKTVTINVLAKNEPIITWANPADIRVGTALSADQLNATANVEGTFVYTPEIGTILSIGANQNLQVDFTPTDLVNYIATSKTVTINVIAKLDPIITWTNPADITAGTALSATQLNATADVAGTFVYTPVSGTVLSLGANQNLQVDFTPTDAVNYNTATKTVTINVIAKQDPIITWDNPADITEGTALSATQLNATADVAGTFVYTPASGTLLSAGANQNLQVDFTPTDAVNYNTATKTVTITVNALAIGDSYQGGIIAYILQSGDPGYDANITHGLIAAPSDQSTGIRWFNGSYIITGATGEALGSGQANTTTIVTAQGAGSYAAQLCNDLVLNGYSDWYLPNKAEINKLYLNRLAVGGFIATFYWTSNENGNSAWGQDFVSGGQAGGFDKAALNYVRAVRSF